ncbi:MAG TPA: hypothetical protein DDW26_06570 [Rhizobiales bacterium]|nr:hypothetical protein [Hyphomicrobiales bacterium]
MPLRVLLKLDQSLGERPALRHGYRTAASPRNARSALQAWLRPGFAPLQRAAFRNSAIEWKQHSTPGCSAHGVAPLPEPALTGAAPPILASPLAAARNQKLACHHVALTLVSHGAQC